MKSCPSDRRIDRPLRVVTGLVHQTVHPDKSMLDYQDPRFTWIWSRISQPWQTSAYLKWLNSKIERLLWLGVLTVKSQPIFNLHPCVSLDL